MMKYKSWDFTTIFELKFKSFILNFEFLLFIILLEYLNFDMYVLYYFH